LELSAKRKGARNTCSCKSWRSAVVQEGGGFAPSEQTEKFRLSRNNIRFHELTYTELTVALTELTKNLLLPRLNTVIDMDQQLCWAWSAEILLARESAFQREMDHEITELASAAFRAALASIRPPGQQWDQAVLVLQQVRA
jgi:primosomal protein N''